MRHLWWDTAGVSPVLFEYPWRARTRITVCYRRTCGTGKLRLESLLRAPVTAGTWPSRLALSTEVRGDFPQSGELRGAFAKRSPCVCSEACLGGVPPVGHDSMMAATSPGNPLFFRQSQLWSSPRRHDIQAREGEGKRTRRTNKKRHSKRLFV